MIEFAPINTVMLEIIYGIRFCPLSGSRTVIFIKLQFLVAVIHSTDHSAMRQLECRSDSFIFSQVSVG